jgi:hypothetical protein
MAIKNGYGTLVDIVNGSANTAAVIQLPSKNVKRIFSIDCAYSLRSGATNTLLIGGRLLVVGSRYEALTEAINPRDIEYNTALQGVAVYFDAPLFPDDNVEFIGKSFSWANGLTIPDGTEASIILSMCYGDGIAAPGADDVNAFLNVTGIVGGSEKPFKNV